MSNINPNISNTSVIPNVDTPLFDANPTARFAVGTVAVGDKILPGHESIYQGYLRLRANVYAYQTGILAEDQVERDGTERDEDDVRSIHFAVVENAIASPRVVASMRLIVKSKEHDAPLPIENFFPDAFKTPAPLNSTEVSRHICRHEDVMVQRGLKWPLYALGLSYVLPDLLQPTYAVVEPELERGLHRSKVFNERVAELQYVPEYNTANVGIKYDTEAIARSMNLSSEALQAVRSSAEDFIYLKSIGKTDPGSSEEQIAA